MAFIYTYWVQLNLDKDPCCRQYAKETFTYLLPYKVPFNSFSATKFIGQSLVVSSLLYQSLFSKLALKSFCGTKFAEQSLRNKGRETKAKIALFIFHMESIEDTIRITTATVVT